MNKYNTYHSAVKTSFALGIHNQVLPLSFLKSIPRSTTQNWKDIPADKFVGGEFASQIETDLDKVKTLLDERAKKLTTAYYHFVDYIFAFSILSERKTLKKLFFKIKNQLLI